MVNVVDFGWQPRTEHELHFGWFFRSIICSCGWSNNQILEYMNDFENEIIDSVEWCNIEILEYLNDFENEIIDWVLWCNREIQEYMNDFENEFIVWWWVANIGCRRHPEAQPTFPVAIFCINPQTPRPITHPVQK